MERKPLSTKDLIAKLVADAAVTPTPEQQDALAKLPAIHIGGSVGQIAVTGYSGPT